MPPRSPALALAAAVLLCPSAVLSACSTEATGAGCVRVLETPLNRAPLLEASTRSSGSAAGPSVAVGEVLPRGRYSIILNADYYGLPPVSDGWVYMRVGHDAYRVDWRSHQVLERVTERAAANF
ncbi:hypothetical protein [Rubellimicrobium arenae]|uniref:hypothetical protein n=1 Tax=Rubellimicrobium arenae TaxID=2817372 RepID=UPI001B30DBB7|nr:hypothetical protein [Rubellimicrobium arenae]